MLQTADNRPAGTSDQVVKIDGCLDVTNVDARLQAVDVGSVSSRELFKVSRVKGTNGGNARSNGEHVALGVARWSCWRK